MNDYLLRIYFEQCLSTAAWAGGAALAVHLLASLGTTAPARAAAVALALGLFTALYTVAGVPPLPPAMRWQWVPWLTAAALLLLLVEEGKSAEGARVPLLLALTLAVEWFILRPNGRLAQFGEAVRLAFLVGLGTAFLALLWVGETRLAKAPMWRTFALQSLATAGAAAAYASHSQDFGRIMAGFAAALGATALVGLAKATETTGRTAVTVSGVAACGILLVNGLGSDFPIACTLLLLAAWLAPLLPNRGTFVDHALQFCAAVAPAALAAFIASW